MITVHQLTKHYRSVAAVDGLTFEVGPGRVTGFLGPNGAGQPNLGNDISFDVYPSDLTPPATIRAVRSGCRRLYRLYRRTRAGRGRIRASARLSGSGSALLSRTGVNAARPVLLMTLIKPTRGGCRHGYAAAARAVLRTVMTKMI